MVCGMVHITVAGLHADGGLFDVDPALLAFCSLATRGCGYEGKGLGTHDVQRREECHRSLAVG